MLARAFYIYRLLFSKMVTRVIVEADSTVVRHRLESESTVTEVILYCSICVSGFVEEERLARLINETTECVIFDQSTVLLVCVECRQVVHLHCHLSRSVSKSDLREVLENPYRCNSCA